MWGPVLSPPASKRATTRYTTLLAARLETGDHKGRPYTTSLAGPRRRQLDHLAHVRRIDKTGASLEDAVRDGIEIRLVQRQQDDGQVSLEILLLVNSEQHLTTLDRIEHIGRQVEGSQLDLSELVQILQRFDGRADAHGAQHHTAVDRRTMRERSLDLRLA